MLALAVILPLISAQFDSARAISISAMKDVMPGSAELLSIPSNANSPHSEVDLTDLSPATEWRRGLSEACLNSPVWTDHLCVHEERSLMSRVKIRALLEVGTVISFQ